MAKSALSNNQYQQIVSINNVEEGWANAGPITIHAVTSNPTKGTTSVDKFWWKRNGDSMDCRLEFLQTGAGSAGTGRYLFKMHGNLKIDTTKVTASTNEAGYAVGTCYVAASSTDARIGGRVFVYDQDYITFNLDPGTSQSEDAVGSSNFDLTSATRGYTAFFSVPIQGWSNSQTYVMNVADPYENTYSARIGNNGSSASVVSESKPNSITVTRVSPGIITVNWSALGLTVTPSIRASIDGSTSSYSGTRAAEYRNATPTGCTIETKYSDAGGNGFFDYPFSISLEKQGVDYKEPKGYFISSGTLTKWQKKTLPSQVTSNGVVSALGFNNLEIGKTYKLITQIHHLCVSNVTSTLVYTNGGNTVLASEMDPEGAGGVRRTAGNSTIFTATATTLVATATVSGGAAIETLNTWAILEEVPWHQQTIQWT